MPKDKPGPIPDGVKEWGFEADEAAERLELQRRDEAPEARFESSPWTVIREALTKTLTHMSGTESDAGTPGIDFARTVLQRLPVQEDATVRKAIERLLKRLKPDLRASDESQRRASLLRLRELDSRLRGIRACEKNVESAWAKWKGGAETVDVVGNAQNRLNDVQLGFCQSLLAFLPLDREETDTTDCLAMVDCGLRLRFFEARSRTALVTWRIVYEKFKEGVASSEEEAQTRAFVHQFDGEVHAALARFEELRRIVEHQE